MDDGDVAAQRRLFHLVDAGAGPGKGDVVDGWGAELGLMRGRMAP